MQINIHVYTVSQRNLDQMCDAISYSFFHHCGRELLAY